MCVFSFKTYHILVTLKRYIKYLMKINGATNRCPMQTKLNNPNLLVFPTSIVLVKFIRVKLDIYGDFNIS